MRGKRLSAFLMVLVMLFTLVGQFATPISAIKAKDLGISVSSKQYYNYDKKCYTIKLTVKLTQGAAYHPLEAPTVQAYLYDASGKCVSKWTNGGKGSPVDKSEKAFAYNIDAAKLKSGEYTFKFYVSCEYFDDRWNSVDTSFYWKYTLNRADMIQSLKFKQMSYTTDSNGKTQPRINAVYQNIKGQTLTVRFYDKYDNVIYSKTSKPKDAGRYSTWFSWDGRADGSQYPDGTYKVKISSSGGLSITEAFYFDFPGYNKK